MGKDTKFQGNGLFPSGVLSHLLGWRWKTPPGAYRVKIPLALLAFEITLKEVKTLRG